VQSFKWYNSYIRCRFSFDPQKSRRLKANPRRGIGFEAARDRTFREYHVAVGWVADL